MINADLCNPDINQITSVLKQVYRPFSEFYQNDELSFNELAWQIMREIKNVAHKNKILLSDKNPLKSKNELITKISDKFFHDDETEAIIVVVKVSDLPVIDISLGHKIAENIMRHVEKIVFDGLDGLLFFWLKEDNSFIIVLRGDRKNIIQIKKMQLSINSSMINTCGHLVAIKAENAIFIAKGLENTIRVIEDLELK